MPRIAASNDRAVCKVKSNNEAKRARPQVTRWGGAPRCSSIKLLRRLDAVLGGFFGAEVRAFAVPTGTAANALSLATLAPPYGAIYCHEEAHIATDECGAPGFFTGGAQLVLLPEYAGVRANVHNWNASPWGDWRLADVWLDSEDSMTTKTPAGPQKNSSTARSPGARP